MKCSYECEAKASNIISGLMCTILILFDCFVVSLILDTMESKGFIQTVRTTMNGNSADTIHA